MGRMVGRSQGAPIAFIGIAPSIDSPAVPGQGHARLGGKVGAEGMEADGALHGVDELDAMWAAIQLDVVHRAQGRELWISGLRRGDGLACVMGFAEQLCRHAGEAQGFVECVATPGGKRRAGTEERRFLVPAAEYEIGRFGFVIDPDRHTVCEGPSSFVGWQGRRSP